MESGNKLCVCASERGASLDTVVTIIDTGFKRVLDVHGIERCAKLYHVAAHHVAALCDDASQHMMLTTSTGYQLHRHVVDGAGVATLDATSACTYPGTNFFKIVSAPSGLYATRYGGGDGESVVCIDPVTLEVSRRFGADLLKDVRGLAVVGDEVYVCDFHYEHGDVTQHGYVKIFSLAGEYRRQISCGEGVPIDVHYFDERLYIFMDMRDEDEDSMGLDILVCTLRGKVLQQYHVASSIVENGNFEYCFLDSERNLLITGTDTGKHLLLQGV